MVKDPIVRLSVFRSGGPLWTFLSVTQSVTCVTFFSSFTQHHSFTPRMSVFQNICLNFLHIFSFIQFLLYMPSSNTFITQCCGRFFLSLFLSNYLTKYLFCLFSYVTITSPLWTVCPYLYMIMIVFQVIINHKSFALIIHFKYVQIICLRHQLIFEYWHGLFRSETSL